MNDTNTAETSKTVMDERDMISLLAGTIMKSMVSSFTFSVM